MFQVDNDVFFLELKLFGQLLKNLFYSDLIEF